MEWEFVLKKGRKCFQWFAQLQSKEMRTVETRAIIVARERNEYRLARSFTSSESDEGREIPEDRNGRRAAQLYRDEN